jgi:acetyl-CoA decarbonylase/synthase complex subunit gamma
MKIKSPMEVYKYLPGTNCGDCGEKTCVAFAAKLIERTVKVEDCPPLLEEKDMYEELKGKMAPEIAEVVIGTDENVVKIGGEDVIYRHELTFYDRCALACDVWDTMSDDDLIERVEAISDFKKFYVGNFLTLDMIALRSVSNDPDKFGKFTKLVSEHTNLPLIICSFDPKVVEAGLDVIGDRNPLIYAATKDNWREFADLALKYKTPVTLSSPGDLDLLKSLAKTFSTIGIDDLVLDPGTYPIGKGLEQTLANFIRLRRAGIAEGQKDVAFPLMSVPMTAWMVQKDPIEAAYWEDIIASVFIIKYADIMILHSIEPYTIITEMTLDKNIYTDPRRPVSVDAGIRELGNPDEKSPVFLTSNFALTYYTVESDLVSNKIDCYLVVLDTDGIGVQSAVAGGQFSAGKVKDTFAGTDLAEKVPHKTMVIPGLAARISGETEDETGWRVLIGPEDSGRIPGFIEKNWPPE